MIAFKRLFVLLKIIAKLTEIWISSDKIVEELACQHQIFLGFEVGILTNLE